MRRTKIICTLGPSSSEPAMIRELAMAGMDVARLNFSHGDHEFHAQLIARVRQVGRELGKEIPILQDLAGPKLRTGLLVNRQPVRLEPGQKVTLFCGDEPGDAQRLSTSIDLSADVKPGDSVLLADGLLELRVDATPTCEVVCTVLNGGLLGERKGINLPGALVNVPALTDKDFADLDFGLDQGVDYVALSFVRSENDLHLLHERIRMWASRHDGRGLDTPVIAKLEKPQALDRLPEILQFVDAVMVARGDLGVEVPLERVPALQKHIIRSARHARLPVITATQMLGSMTRQPRPTRAEASDVANAVLDGSDALMLSEETASGDHPIAAVRMMDRIISEAEKIEQPALPPAPSPDSIPDTIAGSVALAARNLPLSAIAIFTKTGATARLLSGYRPHCPVYALAPSERTRARLALYWGVQAMALPEMNSTDDMLGRAEAVLIEKAGLRSGQTVAIVAGTPFGVAGRTNLMKIVRL